ncbi:MAG: DUF2306 domain-containing protein [Hamadaea sp.]|nr:DUF2306 domain-containing protein [Hamadaea sp.]
MRPRVSAGLGPRAAAARPVHRRFDIALALPSAYDIRFSAYAARRIYHEGVAVKRPWIGPLVFVVVAFLAFSLPPYLTLQAQNSRLPLDPASSWHYPLLLGHITFGTVALVTCCMQIWPWLRRKNPALHRRTGRVYVLGGVLPAGLLGVPVALLAVTPSVAGKVGNATLAIVWLAVTVAGFRAARAQRYAEHRRWMIRSFALTTSIVVNRLWTGVVLVALMPMLDSQFGGDEGALVQSAVDAAIWLSWVVNLLIAEWWIERGQRPRRKARRDAAFAPDDAAPAPVPAEL